ncbi:MAG: electron transporter RnfB [Erysipelotrichaceae bacterium]|nr:electron transporter RnfB [Erysipelotrichaceae bacterium]
MEIIKAVLLMLVLGGVIGVLLGIASVKLYVEEDHRVEDVLAMLPGYNCGGCGNPGCAGMAAKLVEGESTIDKCKPCKADAREAIVAYLREHAA